MVLRDMLGQNINFALMQTQIQKIKKKINLDQCKNPLIDEKPCDKDAAHRNQIDDEHQKIKEQMTQKVRELELMIPTDEVLGIEGVGGAGVQPDSVSLLSQIAGQYFQCIVVCEDELQEMTLNPKMKFKTNIIMNGQVVSKGFGPNKKASKQAGVNILLSLICPNIYKQWQEKKEREAELSIVARDLPHHQELLTGTRPFSAVQSLNCHLQPPHEQFIQKYDQQDIERVSFEQIQSMPNLEISQQNQIIPEQNDKSLAQSQPLREKVSQVNFKIDDPLLVSKSEIQSGKENLNPNPDETIFASEQVRRKERTSRRITEHSVQKTWEKYQKGIQLEKERQEAIISQQKQLQEKKKAENLITAEIEKPIELNLSLSTTQNDLPIIEEGVKHEDSCANSAFTPEQLERIRNGTDAFIDDPDIMASKRELLQGFTPLGTINVLQNKIKHFQVVKQEKLSQRDPTDPTKMIFGFSISLPTNQSNQVIYGYGEESTKKCAQHTACQKFLKNLFPPGTTWNELVDIIQNQNAELSKIIARAQGTDNVIEAEGQK